MRPKTTRSPRRLPLDHPALQAVALDDNPPAPDSFAWRLWLDAQDLAQEALSTDYIQGIANGNLDPDDYGQYTVQDSAYCFAAQNDYKRAEGRALREGEGGIAAFAQARYDSYVQYTDSQFTAWHLKDPSALAPGPAAQMYIDTEHLVAESAPPIYVIVEMIPCDQLWPWLAGQLQDKAGPANLYSFWITGNASWKGAYRLDNFLNAWVAQHPRQIDQDAAQAVFRACMTCEVNFFRSACGQSLLPMPQLPAFS